MKWTPCIVDSPSPAGAAPSARMGHVAVAVDARESWGDEILVIHGGLSEGKYALGDVIVYQSDGNAWSRPDIPATGPHARAFHCAAVVSTKVFMFGGHVWVKEKKGLQKFNDLWCLNTVSATCTSLHASQGITAIIGIMSARLVVASYTVALML